jgi:putative transposase
MFVFQSLCEVREETEKWVKEYNEERPHQSLGHMTPREYLLTPRPEISTNDRTKIGRVTTRRKFQRRFLYC